MMSLDPNDFIVVPHVAALDEFKLTNEDGSFIADINADFLKKLVERMREREEKTGDLCPIVIGHTQDGLPEIEQPPLIGFARNWHLDTLGNTGRLAAFFDAWIFKDKVDIARQYPRRSCEIWASRYEVDPISFLGATTPARDLGLLKLQAGGSFVYYSPGESNMPDESQTGAYKTLEGKLDQVLTYLQRLIDTITQPPAPEEPTPSSDDDEYEEILKQLTNEQNEDEDEPRPAEPDAKTANLYPGGLNTETRTKLSRLEQENAEMRAQLSRLTIREELLKLQRQGKDINPDDEQLLADLSVMPPEIRRRQLEYIAKNARPLPSAASPFLDAALESGPRKRMDRETMLRLSRKAAEQRKTFEQVAAEEGYDLT